MAKEHRYNQRLTWTGAAGGPTRSYDSYARDFTVEIEGKPALKGTADPQFRGDPHVHNPEDLLLAAIAGCHMLTYLSWAARKGVAVTAYADAPTATMTLEGGRGQFTRALLKPTVTVAPGSDLALAESLHEAAHRDCFVARSVNFPVEYQPTTVEAGAKTPSVG